VNEFLAVPEFPNVWAPVIALPCWMPKLNQPPAHCATRLREGLIAAKKHRSHNPRQAHETLSVHASRPSGRPIRELGQDRTRTVDVRIIAATNRDVAAEVKAGRFRQESLTTLSSRIIAWA